MRHLALLSIILLWITPPALCQDDQLENSFDVKLLSTIKQSSDAAEFAMPFVYVSHRGIFSVFDITSPSTPQVKGSIDLKTTSSQIQLAGDIALVGSVSGALHIVSITEPQNPELLSTCILPGAPVDIIIRHKHAFVRYVSRDKCGFVIVDFSSAREMKLIGQCDLSMSQDTEQHVIDHMIINVTPSGETVLLNTWTGYRRSSDSCDTLMIIDVTDPLRPVVVKKIQAKAPIVNIFSSDKHARIDYYHAHVNFTDVPEIDGSLFLEISNPANPVFIDAKGLNLDGRGKSGPYYMFETVFAGTTLYRLTDEGIEFMDITDSKHCRQLKFFPLQDCGINRTNLWVKDKKIMVREVSRENYMDNWLNILVLEVTIK